ncbi:MAG: Asp-tRNA(Asn)/Glu-tRNA(Gln) amidotransferase subunit GatC [Victivallaceae bacterium]
MTQQIIDPSVLRKIAAVAAICLDEESIPEYTKYLIDVVDYISQFDELDFEDGISECEGKGFIEPKDSREDAVKDLLAREEFLSNAPDQLGGMIKVPVVIK